MKSLRTNSAAHVRRQALLLLVPRTESPADPGLPGHPPQDMLQLLRVRDRFQRPYHRLLRKPKPRAAAAAAAAAATAADDEGDAAAQAHDSSTAEGASSSSSHSSSTDTTATSSSSSSGQEGQLSDEELSAIIRSAFPPSTLGEAQLGQLLSLERELQARGRFLPLMSIFPYDAAQHKWKVPWREADLLARTWMGLRRQYLERS